MAGTAYLRTGSKVGRPYIFKDLDRAPTVAQRFRATMLRRAVRRDAPAARHEVWVIANDEGGNAEVVVADDARVLAVAIVSPDGEVLEELR